MAVRHEWLLQQAVYQVLTAALVGQAIDGDDVPVFDHVPADPPRLHLRIDGFGVVPGDASNDDRARHEFRVHIFDENTGDQTGGGNKEVMRLQAIVVAALEDWPPITGATGIMHLSSNSAADDSPQTRHRFSRFSTQI
jgi:hypothetical protein